MGRSGQRVYFRMGERARLAFGQISELQRTDSDAHKPQNVHTKPREQTPNVPILAFIEDNFNPTVQGQ